MYSQKDHQNSPNSCNVVSMRNPMKSQFRIFLMFVCGMLRQQIALRRQTGARTEVA